MTLGICLASFLLGFLAALTVARMRKPRSPHASLMARLLSGIQDDAGTNTKKTGKLAHKIDAQDLDFIGMGTRLP